MKKRALSFLAALVLLVSLFCIPVSAEFDPQTRNSVVVVNTCLDMDGGVYSFGWGSGFFVGHLGQDPLYLVTNHHVIEDFLTYGEGEVVSITIDGVSMVGRAKIRVYYDSKDYEEAYIVGFDSHKDVAVLKLAAPTSKRTPLPLHIPTDSMVGSRVYAVGYPGLSENIWAGATTSWGISDSTVTSGPISRLFVTSGTGVESVQIDCEIKHGNSGGPVISEQNGVVGIATYFVTNENDVNGTNYAINITEAITIMNQYSVPYDLVNPTPVPSDVPTPTPTPVPDDPDPFPTAAIIAIAAVVVAAIVAAAIILTRKKSAAPQPAPVSPQPAQPAAQKRAYVRSLAPQHRGSRSPVGPQPGFIGRSQECIVAYQGNTPGVSGRHCSVQWDPTAGDFILTDLQSTYGTYLQNGQKLTPNVAYHLRPGDQFYLGERANMLQVYVE